MAMGRRRNHHLRPNKTKSKGCFRYEVIFWGVCRYHAIIRGIMRDMREIKQREELSSTIEEHKAAITTYENELEKLKTDPSHYMTPGARRYFYRVAGAYAILAVSFTIGIYAMTDLLTDKLRTDINKYLVISCKSSIPTLTRFNAKLDADIRIQEDAQIINIEQGELERAKLNQEAIEAAERAKFPIPTAEECELRGDF